MARSFIGLLLVLAGVSVASAQTLYDPDILTIIENHGCGGCHGGSGGLTVTPYEDLLSTGNHAPVVVAFDTNSVIVQKLKGIASFGSRMPFGGPYLSDAEIATVVRWVKEGAKKSASTDVALTPSLLPDRATLLQNYPNPFNPTTMIRYALPAAGRGRLVVVDLVGREVRVVFDGEQPAGERSVLFDASTLPSGAYYYRLEAPGVQLTRKMLLLR